MARPEASFHQETEMRPYINPVYSKYFADPFVWQSGDIYYAIGTGPGEAEGRIPRSVEPCLFPLLRSQDLVNWQAAGYALVPPDVACGHTFWAPEIVYADHQWYLYYSVGHADTLHQLRVAISEHPLGPYRDCAQLTNPLEVPFAIDPHPFRDEDGCWYLFHARDFLDTEADGVGPVHAGTALVVSRLETMTRLSPDVRTVLRARCEWQLFAAQRPMYGRVFDWHTLEGPFVIKEKGRYYCLYSGGCWQTDTYGVDYTVADHVLGPYEPVARQAGPRVLRTVPGKVIGPGHCSVVMAPDDATRMIIYHAWDSAMTARRMCIDPLLFDAGGLRSLGPSWAGDPVMLSPIGSIRSLEEANLR